MRRGLIREISRRWPGLDTCSGLRKNPAGNRCPPRFHCPLSVAEWFPYVPHTCYLRPGCSPIAGNCARYARLRVCCCEAVTAAKCE